MSQQSRSPITIVLIISTLNTWIVVVGTLRRPAIISKMSYQVISEENSQTSLDVRKVVNWDFPDSKLNLPPNLFSITYIIIGIQLLIKNLLVLLRWQKAIFFEKIFHAKTVNSPVFLGVVAYLPISQVIPNFSFVMLKMFPDFYSKFFPTASSNLDQDGVSPTRTHKTVNCSRCF